MDIVTLIGTMGAGLILVGFVANQRCWLSAESIWYDGINLIGSLLLVVYSILLESVPFLVLNLVWLGASLWDVSLFVRQKLQSE